MRVYFILFDHFGDDVNSAFGFVTDLAGDLGVKGEENIHAASEFNKSEFMSCFSVIAFFCVEDNAACNVPRDLAEDYFMMRKTVDRNCSSFVLGGRFFVPGD